MKQVVAVLIVAIVGCGKTDKPEEIMPIECGSAQTALYRCRGAGLLEQCDGTDWLDIQDCGGAGFNCSATMGTCELPDGFVCSHEGMTFARESVVANPYQRFYQYSARNTEASPYDVMLVQSYQDPTYLGPTEPGTYSVTGSNYQDCGLCLLARRGCDATGECDKVFYADMGRVDISAIDDHHFAGTLQGVTFREVTINQSTFVSTPVPGGETWCVDGLSIDYVKQPTVDVCVEQGNGPLIGDNIANFSLQNCNGELVDLHSFCGQSKANWFILVAGWCPACSLLVRDVADNTMPQLGPQGLEVMVMYGEDDNYDTPSMAECQEYADSHGISRANVYLDTGWGNFFTYVYPYLGESIALPWSAVLAGSNMEYVYSDETGGNLDATISGLLSE